MSTEAARSLEILKVSNVVFEYPRKRALDDVSFSLSASSVTALVGPNGSGKSTLLRCLAALENPYSGSVHIGGIDSTHDPRACHNQIGYLSDSFGLYDNLQVDRCLIHQGSIHGLTGRALQEGIERVSEQLHLEPIFKQRAGDLSRGQRQRVGVALTLLHQPKILLLDEPASGLDPEARSELSLLLRKLRDEGYCILVSSHILAELEDYCDRMLILREGKILADEQVKHSERGTSVSISLDLLNESIQLHDFLVAESKVSRLMLRASGASFHFEGTAEEQAALLKRLIDSGIPVLQFACQQLSMESVYLNQLMERAKNES